MTPPDDGESAAELRAARKRASNIGLLLGGLAFVVGALVCLVYLLVVQPWKFPAP